MTVNFIFTTDTETANKLLSAGFQQIPAASVGYKFINNTKVTFEENGIDPQKIKYTNMLTM